jgi:putative transposase
MVEKSNSPLTISEKCDLLELPRSSYYYKSCGETDKNIELMKLIDEIHTDHITWGSRKIRDFLRNEGHKVNRKRIQRLMNKMQIQVLYPKRNLSRANKNHKVYPYLLRNLSIDHPNHVWCTDITYIRLDHGFTYLVAVMDWYSKKILSWELSNTVDRFFCISSLEEALEKYPNPEIFNTDQGSQFTSPDFTKVLKDESIKISMDGKGRALDNISIERFWRTLKQDEIYLHEYRSMQEARDRINKFIDEYNSIRPHQSLNGKTPDMVYYGELRQTIPA